MSRELTGSPPPLGVNVRHARGHVTIDLVGELDLATAPRLRDQLAQVSEDGADHITLDLTGLDFIDSTGLSVLVMAYTRAQSSGGALTVRHPSAAVMRIFEITGLASVFTIETGDAPDTSAGE